MNKTRLRVHDRMSLIDARDKGYGSNKHKKYIKKIEERLKERWPYIFNKCEPLF